jgi:hypothetical protein
MQLSICNAGATVPEAGSVPEAGTVPEAGSVPASVNASVVGMFTVASANCAGLLFAPPLPMILEVVVSVERVCSESFHTTVVK